MNIYLLNLIFLIFWTKPPLSILVTGTENGFQNMVTGREIGFQNWLPEQNVDSNIGYRNTNWMPILGEEKLASKIGDQNRMWNPKLVNNIFLLVTKIGIHILFW